ncbi:hypothetical protein JF544_10560 [Halobacillus kuroshimensis]|uniref:Uncharacterized protein n=1 Tax=Halobacillus kuroshimensis TaxID=302481 RepID=A0ABS3DWJ8_9BACI|nr:hypothetical protein [Halobacillus kuroshimensis]MBN8235691.1 hypothetical protein [Halobacillus kuroshimensis]
MGVNTGCSAEFWGALQNIPQWPEAYSICDRVNTVFDVCIYKDNLNLLFALNLPIPSTPTQELALEGTAALLNAAHSLVNYPLTEDEVIAIFQEAVETENYEDAISLFAAYNNLFCPL